jgi:uncharacterized protein YdaU (DUF1376 family)
VKYYPHHIGDFDKKTRHLTRIERSIYRDLMDLYYDTESPLILDTKELCRKVLARTEEESTAVEQVLNEFFTKTKQGWYHSNCEEVIQEYRDSISAKSAAGKASAAKREAERLAKLNSGSTDVPTGVEQVLNDGSTDGQLTNTQYPETNTQEPVERQSPAAPKKPRSAKTSLPNGFCISDRVMAWAVEKGYTRLDQHFENFVGACKAKGYTYADWDEGFMGAIRNDWAKVNGQPRASPDHPTLGKAGQVTAANAQKFLEASDADQ